MSGARAPAPTPPPAAGTRSPGEVPAGCRPGPGRGDDGFALLGLLALLTLWGLYVFVGQLDAARFLAERTRATTLALAEARDALISDAVTRTPISETVYLRMPDLGAGVGGNPAEGQASPTFAGDGKDLSVIGKLPWRTLGATPARDLTGECLWYVVSGRFKNDSDLLKTDVLNWDTSGQIDVIDGSGNLLASGLAALVVAPGKPVDGQIRALADAAYAVCGGNYDARNYLDAYEAGNALAGEVNYFSNTTNHRVAADGSTKRFVLAKNDHYNDGFVVLSSDDLFNPMIQRSDFRDAVGALLDYFKTQHDDIVSGRTSGSLVVIAGSKGTDNLACNAAPDPVFCRNWKEMLLLAQLPSPAKITIDGTLTGDACNRVLLFAGRRTAAQSRLTSAAKSDPNNYLEGDNASAFAVPVASTTNFSGWSLFDSAAASNDLLRCLL